MWILLVLKKVGSFLLWIYVPFIMLATSITEYQVPPNEILWSILFQMLYHLVVILVGLALLRYY